MQDYIKAAKIALVCSVVAGFAYPAAVATPSFIRAGISGLYSGYRKLFPSAEEVRESRWMAKAQERANQAQERSKRDWAINERAINSLSQRNPFAKKKNPEGN